MSNNIEFLKNSFSYSDDAYINLFIFERFFDFENYKGCLISHAPLDPLRKRDIDHYLKKYKNKNSIELLCNSIEINDYFSNDFDDEYYFRYVYILHFYCLNRLKAINKNISMICYSTIGGGVTFNFLELKPKLSITNEHQGDEFSIVDFDEDDFIDEITPIINQRLLELNYSRIINYQGFYFLETLFDAEKFKVLMNTDKLVMRDREEIVNQIYINDIIKSDDFIKCDIAADIAYQIIMKTFVKNNFNKGYVVKYYNDNFTKIIISFGTSNI